MFYTALEGCYYSSDQVMVTEKKLDSIDKEKELALDTNSS
jgi:hypothetical protein